MPSDPLLLCLRKLGRRMLMVRLAAGIGWGITAAAALALVAAWLDLLWEMEPGLRLLCGAFAGVAAAVVLAGSCWLGYVKAAPQRLAKRIDRVAQTGGEIRSGVDLVFDSRPAAELTRGLAEMAIVRAGRLAATINRTQIVPRRPAVWGLGSVGVTALVVFAAFLIAPRLALTQWLRFADPFGDHPPFSRVLFHVSPGDVRLVYGAGFDIRVRTEGVPVERLDLILRAGDAEGDDAMPMFPETDGEWRATVANVTSAGHYHVRAAAGRSSRFRIDVYTIPSIDKVRYRVVPPAYTRKPAYEGPLPHGGLEGLPQTQVQIWASSNRPLARGTLTVPGEAGNQSVTLTPTGSAANEVTGSFVISKPGKLALTVVDTDEQSCAEPYTAVIGVLKDERPFIRIVEPPALSLATPNANLPVLLDAEDDYGVARVQLHRSLNSSRPIAQEIALPSVPLPRWSGTVALPLERYGLSSGDEIKLFARVEDNDPAGPNGSESALAVIRIISQEEFEKLFIERQGMEAFLSKYRAAQRRLEKLADQVDKLQKKLKDMPANDPLGKELQQELEKLTKDMREQAEAIRKSSEQLLPFDLDKHLSRQLQEMSRRLERLSQARPGAATARGLAKLLKQWKRELGTNQRELEQQAVEPLELLASVLMLLQDATRFVDLYQRQVELAERLKSLEGKDRPTDPATKVRMRDLQNEQRELRADLARLLEDIEEHAKLLPDEPHFAKLRKDAQEFVRLVRGSGAANAMLDAETGLAELSGTRGYRSARKAAEILAKFVGRCQGGGGMMNEGKVCLGFCPTLQEGMGQTLEQLLSKGAGPAGVGNGYSARRNTLDNIGLYGSLPAMGEASSFSKMKQGRAGGNYRGKGAGRMPQAAGSASREGEAAGSSPGAVPATYRRRVAEYFQRIAEETGK